ncbi:hypothetical protein [uncultured Piscinibacter sp.]|uniref:hypothetical protein n=1 Tax=uncultured Piscinibacter sp. TaxID=1131835 RepID=UPI00261773C8|nr:hypothetical protein [uncultured Piscinibacter sp.]
MIACGSHEYAHARVHARHGQRLDAAAWRRIEVMRDFSPLLELARGTALRPWLVGITADSDAHQVEAVLRRHWRALVDELVAWMPGEWRPALAWCTLLPDLALLQHLARGGTPMTWMEDDDRWRALCAATPAARQAMLATGPAADLAGAWAAPRSFGAAWRDAWQRRLPRPRGDAQEMLTRLVDLLVEHHQDFAEAQAGQGWRLRGELQARLTLLLRRAALQPAAVFAHLALCALDLERLRAELLRRRLFGHWKLA